MQPSRFKFIKIKLSCSQSHYNYIFKIILNLKSKFRGPLSQVTASKHSNAFTFTLFSLYFHSTLIRRTSGRSLGTFLQNDALSPPHNKVSVTSPRTFLFIYYSTISLSLSLSLSPPCYFLSERPHERGNILDKSTRIAKG
jgi:hypothetical protein